MKTVAVSWMTETSRDLSTHNTMKVHKKSQPAYESMKDKVLNEDGNPRNSDEPKESNIKKQQLATKQNTEIDGMIAVDYAEGLDRILSSIYEKESGAYAIITAMTQLFEARGISVPFEATRFSRTVEGLAEVQAAREIAWLFGLGPEHADSVASHMIDRIFGSPNSKVKEVKSK